MQHPARAADRAHTTDFVFEYARFSAGLQAAHLPPAVVAAAKINLCDTLACAVAGTGAPGVGEVADLVRSWGGAPQAGIWCSAARVPAHDAAWVNGMMAHARDYDDTHDEAVLHAGVSVIPAVLAAAELDPTTTGADVLAGIAVGLELVCRLGVATTIGIIDSGFIYTSLFGYFGATAAVARVLRFDAAQTANAIGIAYSQAAGTHQVTRDGALTKRMQPGFAARAAVLSAQLAQRGISGARHVFEGEDGLFRTYLRGQYDAARLREGLGERFVFAGLSYKPYPCCRFNHTAIDAALAIRSRPGFDATQVRRVEARVNRQAYEAVCTPADMRRAPKTIVQAQFSIPFCVAAALLDGPVGLGHFTEEALTRPDVLALARRVDGRIDPGIERDFSRSISPVNLVVETSSGVLSERIDYPKGHPKMPMTPADFSAKLADALAFSGGAWPAGTADRLHRLVDALETLQLGRQVGEALVV